MVIQVVYQRMFVRTPATRFHKDGIYSMTKGERPKLVGGFKHFLFSPIAGMMIQSDFHIFQGVGQPPTSHNNHNMFLPDDVFLYHQVNQMRCGYGKLQWRNAMRP